MNSSKKIDGRSDSIDPNLINTHPGEAAHWIFSGDEDDYDGFYMNCSHCGRQLFAYERDYSLKEMGYCPFCGFNMSEAINHNGMDK